ncbi:MAG: response regulator [Roseburia sp.]|nr:response regulator [Roseburia sp.]MCM1278791.1 response regulator [Robinsoniella sp.]
MKQIKWNDRYKLGVDFIDREHKLLLSTMDKLLRLSENEEKSEWVCREGVKYLKNHSIEHFEHEEDYMKSINYSEYEIHKRLHNDFRDKTLPALEKEMEESEYSTESIRHFLGVCIGWVVAHTLTEDLAILGKRKSKWTDIPHEKEQEIMEQVVTQSIQDMFQLNAKMISQQYVGENFGKVICCRFIYSGEEKEKWEITLVFEEQLLLKIVGNIFNTQYKKVDDMVINIGRYIAKQFMERIRESFPSLSLFQLEKESLLTHEQLLDSFDRVQPSCSLLFDTGEGYFAFSAASVDFIRSKMESDINHENAIDRVNQYLVNENAEWKHQKKKILVVDDSDFVRSKIVSLFKNDYEVTEVNSSISAIQSITVNRPDLVLLDYEMPVCDGRQTLEMIRSEKVIANIPVIFLTGRGDRESVKKVMALKPEGYLLKTMPEEQIKKIVDDFFARQIKK